MKHMIYEFGNNPLISIAGLLIGVLSIAVGIITYLWTQKKKGLMFDHRSVAIFRDSDRLIEQLEVTYKGKAAENFTLTHLAFWNSGNETIRNADLGTIEPLQICIQHGEILDVELLYQTRRANAIEVHKPTNTSAKLLFKYLDASHGGVVRIIHTARFSEVITLSGTLMGIDSLKKPTDGVIGFLRLAYEIDKTNPDRKVRLTSYLIIGILAFVFAAVNWGTRFSLITWLTITLFVVLAMTVLYVLYQQPVPKRLRRYLEDFGTQADNLV